MPERGDTEVFSNPLPPPMKEESMEDDDLHPLTNDDFRKLMMTPRHATPSASTAMAPPKTSAVKKEPVIKDEDDPAMKRKKKKIYYAKLKKLEEERQQELADRYRDRAQERREGSNKDYEQTDIISTTADYRAVAPDAKADENYAERRKQIIQESKYLGGDMEHTHLVKGLDYALLDKVRAEITSKEEEEEEEMEEAVKDTKKEPKEEEPEPHMQFRTKIARNIFRVLFKKQQAERNELYLPGRMAYVVDLEDEFAESDIPTTLIRSKADCPTQESTATLTTNDIVINKLTQILSYLRQGKRDRKLKKKEKTTKLKEDDKPKLTDDSIYGEIGDYAPAVGKGKEKERDKKDRNRDRHGDRDRERRDDRDRDRRDRDRDRDRYRDREQRHERDVRERDVRERDVRERDVRDRERDRDRPDRDRGDRDRNDRERAPEKRKSYFEKPVEEDDEQQEEPKQSANELVKSINDRFAKGWSAADVEREQTLQGGQGQGEPGPQKDGKEHEMKKKIKNKTSINSYAECYPGMMESADAIDDSDDEVDYTKMDQGNKKGPIGRWDFDTQEEYSDYMANKEALPKAAFQYGVKMADGRKTRRTGPKDEKKELDREWQKIQNIISKRKHGGGGSGSKSKQPKV